MVPVLVLVILFSLEAESGRECGLERASERGLGWSFVWTTDMGGSAARGEVWNEIPTGHREHFIAGWDGMRELRRRCLPSELFAPPV